MLVRVLLAFALLASLSQADEVDSMVEKLDQQPAEMTMLLDEKAHKAAVKKSYQSNVKTIYFHLEEIIRKILAHKTKWTKKYNGDLMKIAKGIVKAKNIAKKKAKKSAKATGAFKAKKSIAKSKKKSWVKAKAKFKAKVADAKKEKKALKGLYLSGLKKKAGDICMIRKIQCMVAKFNGQSKLQKKYCNACKNGVPKIFGGKMKKFAKAKSSFKKHFKPKRTGLLAEYFKTKNKKCKNCMPNLAGRKPNIKKTVSKIDFKDTGGAFNGLPKSYHDHMAARWSGYIRIGKSGVYTFWTYSDDGSMMWIAGKQVVNNGGTHSMRWRKGKRYLKKGWHKFKVTFFEKGGGKGCHAYWQVPGSKKKKIIPSYVFRH